MARTNSLFIRSGEREYFSCHDQEIVFLKVLVKNKKKKNKTHTPNTTRIREKGSARPLLQFR